MFKNTAFIAAKLVKYVGKVTLEGNILDYKFKNSAVFIIMRDPTV